MPPNSSTPSIFIGYRRQETRDLVGRIYDHLVQEFGEDQVFMDVDTLEPGEDFVTAIVCKQPITSAG